MIVPIAPDACWMPANSCWWARQDSNLQPDRYERSALTIELQAPAATAPRVTMGGTALKAYVQVGIATLVSPHLCGLELSMKTLMRAAVLGLALTTATAAVPGMAQAPGATAADTMFRATTFNLSASGETRIAPDMASISLGVMTEGKTAAEALAANATRMTAVMASLKKAGIAERDIQTSGLTLNPQYRYVENQPPVLIGYQVTNQVTVTVRDLKKLGAAVDATVNAGANQVNGISFGLSDPTAAENAAREAAVKALSAKADLYARATGYRVSRLVTLSEGGGYTPQPPMPMLAMAGRAQFKDSTPVASGELNVRIDITGLYEVSK